MICTKIQRSLDWCMGTPELPGIRNRIFYIEKKQIVSWPSLPKDDKGIPTGNTYVGSFVLVPDAVFHYITILGEKSQLSSDAQGEIPNQTQLNKLSAVFPSADKDATMLAAYLNNTDCVFIVQDMKGRYRVVGGKDYATKVSVTQTVGQSGGDAPGTTVSIEASDVVASPFYEGHIPLVSMDDAQLTIPASKWMPISGATRQVYSDHVRIVPYHDTYGDAIRAYAEAAGEWIFDKEESSLLAMRITDINNVQGVTYADYNLVVEGNDNNGTKRTSTFVHNGWNMYYQLPDGTSIVVVDYVNSWASFSPRVDYMKMKKVTVKMTNVEAIASVDRNIPYDIYWMRSFYNREHIEWYIRNVLKMSFVKKK